MTQPILLRDNYWGIEVPDAKHAVIHGSTITWRSGQAQARGFILLPPGTWQIICLSGEITEEQARQISEKVGNSNYLFIDHETDSRWHTDPIISIRSLLRSKGLDTEKTLILKKS